MQTLNRLNFIVAICTACGLIAFSAYHRNRKIPVPRGAFFIAAAVICLAPVALGLLRHGNCWKQRQ
jgi:hypothetical protein